MRAQGLGSTEQQVAGAFLTAHRRQPRPEAQAVAEVALDKSLPSPILLHPPLKQGARQAGLRDFSNHSSSEAPGQGGVARLAGGGGEPQAEEPSVPAATQLPVSQKAVSKFDLNRESREPWAMTPTDGGQGLRQGGLELYLLTGAGGLLGGIGAQRALAGGPSRSHLQENRHLIQELPFSGRGAIQPGWRENFR